MEETVTRHGFGYPPTRDELAVLVPLVAVAISLVCLVFGACLPTFHAGEWPSRVPGALGASVNALWLPLKVSWGATPAFWYALPLWFFCLFLSYRYDMHVLGLATALAALYLLASASGSAELPTDAWGRGVRLTGLGAGYWFWFVGILVLVVSNTITLYLALIDPDDRVQFIANRSYLDQIPNGHSVAESEYELAEPGDRTAPRLAKAFASLMPRRTGSEAKGDDEPKRSSDTNGRKAEKPHRLVRAVYEEGVFRPLTLVDLQEYSTVEFVPRVVS